MGNYEFLITTDRSMMTNHHGLEFIGFMTTGPAYGLPESVWNWICMPKMEVDEEGRPKQAPYGLRKIEAALIDAGFKAAVIDPDHLLPHLKSAKAVMIGHHDFFALGPPSNEWWFLTKKEPVNSKSFKRFMESEALEKARELGVKIVVGGPAAWQWLWKPEYVDRWKISTIIDGEADRYVVDLAQMIVDGEDLPFYVQIGPKESPPLEEIPLIKAPSVNGLVEVMRGCPRGCRFCSVTHRPLRFYTLEMVRKEIEVNVRGGIRGCILHSEDILLYGANGVIPNPEPVLRLHEMAVKHCDTMAWSHASLAGVVTAQSRYRLITKLMNELILPKQEFLGVEVGIETGSPRLAEKVMPNKSSPYPAKMWPEIVEEAFSIMHDHMIIPAATLIVGLPGETEDDVIKTIELLERLRWYRSLIVPMYFVPMGAFRGEDWYRGKIEGVYKELGMLCLEHDLRWAREIMSKYYVKGAKRLPLRVLLHFLLSTYELAFMRFKRAEVRKIGSRGGRGS